MPLLFPAEAHHSYSCCRRAERRAVPSAVKSEALASPRGPRDVPSPGNERLRLNLYVFRRGAQPLESPTEVVVEKFEYFP